MGPIHDRRLEIHRHRLGLTQEKLAEELSNLAWERHRKQVGLDATTISKWERGSRQPSGYYQYLLVQFYETAPEDLGFSRSRSKPKVRSVESNKENASGRATSAPGAMVTGAYLESVELDRQLEVSDLGPKTLEQLDLTVERFGLQYLRTPPQLAFEDFRSCRVYVVKLLNRRQTLTQRARLYELAGWLSALLGHLSFDLGEDVEVAHGHLTTALHLANDVRCDELTAWVRGTQAMVETFDGRPEEAAKFSEAGRQVAPAGSASVVRLWAQEARAYARMGERAQFERAMGSAEGAFDRLARNPTGSIFSFDRPYIPFYAGTAYVWLKEPERARECAEQAIALCDSAPTGWPVARVLARIDLAIALAQQGELEGAGRIGAEALEICANGRRTGPMAKRLSELIGTVQPHRTVPFIRDLKERFRVVFSIGSAGKSWI